MTSLISICIPTYNRPVLLREAIESCLAQQYRPLELVIGDDSPNEETADLIRNFPLPEDVQLRYQRNAPSLGQSANVNDLFGRAAGERLLLLHDDDLLCPGGLDKLDRAWRDFPGARCVYGKQFIVDADGAILDAETAALNERYFRTPRYAGRQASGLVAGLRQQMPNNCYLIDAALARTLLYRRDNEVGQIAVDADFAIRAGREAGAGSFVFIDAFISKYRLSPVSILRNKSLNRGQHLFFAQIRSLKTGTAPEEDARQILLHRLGLDASLDAALAGERSLGLRLLLSRYYGKPLLSKWTLYRLACIVSPRFAMAARRRLGG